MLNKLVFADVTINQGNLKGGVSYTKCINDAEDFSVGTTSSAKIEFTTTSTSMVVGKSCIYSIKTESTGNYQQVGIFVVSEVTKVKEGYKVVAYDNVSKFDIVVDDWWNGLDFTNGISVYDIFTSLCNYTHTIADTGSFVNSDYVVPQKTMNTTNMSGRSVLGFIAMTAGGYAHADEYGKIKIDTYHNTNKSLTSANYTNVDLSDYVVPSINSVWVGMEENDVGYTSGNGKNVLRITYDPLLFVSGDQTIQTQVDNILKAVQDFSYRSGSVGMLDYFMINTGDIIKVNNKTFMVMEKKITNKGCTLTSYGQATREAVKYVDNEIIQAASGKYNTIKATVDALQVEVGDLGEGVETALEQSASAISAVSSKLDATSGTSQTCSWELTPDDWSVSINGTEKFGVNDSGAYVNGVIDATSGTLGNLDVTGAITVKDDNNTIMCQISKVGSGSGFVFKAGSGSYIPFSVYRMSNGVPTIYHLNMYEENTSTYGRNYVNHAWWGVRGGYIGDLSSGTHTYALIWYNLYNTNSSWSDRTKKNSIEDLDDRYSDLFDRLRPVRFKYNAGTSNRYHTGFIAQDINEARDEANLTDQEFAATLELPDDSTAEDPKDFEKKWSLRYNELLALCVKEIQSLKARVAELESKGE